MKKIVPLIFLIFLFLIIKLNNNSIRLSDTNIYFNISYQISKGEILYKDIFFSNFPFFSYVASLYYLLSNKSINLFYFTSAIEAAATSFLIYFIIYKKTKDYLVSISSLALYLFSFMILSTSDHQTGVFTASLFAVLSYLFLEKRKIIISGIFVALAIFTKAYFLPIFLSFVVYFALKKSWKDLIKFTISFGLTGLAILLPFLIISPYQLISDIFGFSLTRPAGLSKMNIAWFFIIRDFPLFILLMFNLINIKNNIFFGLISIFSVIFFFSYQDIYYLYLNFLTPFLCISFYELSNILKRKFNLQQLIIPTIVSIFIIINLLIYDSGYKNLGKLENIDEIIKIIKAQNPKFLYGVNDITPALIALTNIPALENVNDAHEYFFTRNVYNKETLTTKAIDNKTIVIAHGAEYPRHDIKQEILDNIFAKDEILTNCTNILRVPVLSEGDTNRINLFKCY